MVHNMKNSHTDMSQFLMENRQKGSINVFNNR